MATFNFDIYKVSHTLEDLEEALCQRVTEMDEEFGAEGLVGVTNRPRLAQSTPEGREYRRIKHSLYEIGKLRGYVRAAIRFNPDSSSITLNGEEVSMLMELKSEYIRD